MSDEIVPGMAVSRKKLFSADIKAWMWSTDMLTALNTAKNMGFNRFEVELTDVEEIEKINYVQVGKRDSYFSEPTFEQSGTYKEKHQTITVFAVVVE